MLPLPQVQGQGQPAPAAGLAPVLPGFLLGLVLGLEPAGPLTEKPAGRGLER